MRVRRGAVVLLAGVMTVLTVGDALHRGPDERAGASTPALQTSSNTLSFPATTLGTVSGPDTFYLEYPGSPVTPITIDLATDLSFSGPGADDYVVIPDRSDCAGSGSTIDLSQFEHICAIDVYFSQARSGTDPPP